MTELLHRLYERCVSAGVSRQVAALQADVEQCGWSLTPDEVASVVDRNEVVLVDLRNDAERAWHGIIDGAVHVPFPELGASLAPGGLLHRLADGNGSTLIFFCAIGGRSSRAVFAAQDAGLLHSFHMKGGLDAWRARSYPLDKVRDTIADRVA